MADLKHLAPLASNGLTALEAARRLEAGTLTSLALVEDCLARVAAREPVVGAWEFIDPDQARAAARELDASPRRSPLHGIPVGIKDIFDTKDMPTGHGFGPHQGARSGQDSACVAQLRAAGMLILGKTVTTEFACPVRRRTVNPHDPSRSPGVSSSGSAAAVADFMVPLAVGSQTGGSVIGPSANCGVYGYKASLDGIDRGGFRHCKRSIDTIGHFARSVDDLILFRGVQTGALAAASLARDARPRIGIVRSSKWDVAEPAMKAAIVRVAEMLGKAGAVVEDVSLPARFDEIEPDFSVVNGWEAGQTLAAEIRDHFDAFNPHNRARIEFVRTLSASDYARASANLDLARREMDSAHSVYDAFISPSEPGEAPDGLDKVHSANFARLWTQMHMPAVNLPLFTGDHGLPIGFQVIGRRDQDDRLLALAAWIDIRLREALASLPAPAGR